jgi:hypothetical protein
VGTTAECGAERRLVAQGVRWEGSERVDYFVSIDDAVCVKGRTVAAMCCVGCSW